MKSKSKEKKKGDKEEKKKSKSKEKDKGKKSSKEKKEKKEKNELKEKRNSLEESKEIIKINITEGNREKTIDNKQNSFYPPQKCEGCFDNDAIAFCNNCNKLLCNSCNDQIHSIPSLSKHQRIPSYEIMKNKKLCYNHNNILQYYCDSCDEPICYQCQVIGPHNTKQHRINEIKDAFKKKYNQISNYKTKLNTKARDYISGNLYIDEMIKKLREGKKKMERIIRSQYNELIERVKSVEGKKISILCFEISKLQEQLDSITDTINFIDDTSSPQSPDVLEFIMRYKQLMNTIDKINKNPIKEGGDLSLIGDFPNDLEERESKVKEIKEIKKQLEKRDETIWALIIERRKKEIELIKKRKEQLQKEIDAIKNLTKKYEDRLNKLNIVCSFCGKCLDKSNINFPCDKNESFYLNFFFTKREPRKEEINSKHHFFSVPIEDIEEKRIIAERLWKKQQEEMLNKLREKGKKKKDVSKLNYTNVSLENFRQVQQWVIKCAQRIEEDNINFYDLLDEYDIDNDGYITPNDVEMAVMKLDAHLDKEDYDDLKNYFKVQNMTRVKILDFAENFKLEGKGQRNEKEKGKSERSKGGKK